MCYNLIENIMPRTTKRRRTQVIQTKKNRLWFVTSVSAPCFCLIYTKRCEQLYLSGFKPTRCHRFESWLVQVHPDCSQLLMDLVRGLVDLLVGSYTRRVWCYHFWSHFLFSCMLLHVFLKWHKGLSSLIFKSLVTTRTV